MPEEQKIIRFVIIDDHPMTRRGFGNFLSGAGGFEIAGEAASLTEGRDLLEGMQKLPDMVILDIGLGDDNGLDFIGIVQKIGARRGAAPLPVLVYSVFEDPFRIQTAMRMGARGYISKSAEEEELIRAITVILDGKLYIDNRFELTVRRNQDVYAEFTQREREVLAMVKDHQDNESIANALSISLRTVENHLSHIYFKTGIKSREKLLTL